MIVSFRRSSRARRGDGRMRRRPFPIGRHAAAGSSNRAEPKASLCFEREKYGRQDSGVARALVYARKLAELAPGDADARGLVGELERALR